MKTRICLPAAILTVIASIALTGCYSKPFDELKMAGVAMEQARNAEASEYAPNDWDRAQMQWDEANSLVHMERYGEAGDVLALAIGSFNTAREKANRRVEDLKIEIAALQASTATELKNLERAGESAKEKPSVKKQIEEAIPHIEERIVTMNTAYDAREYLRARKAGQEAARYFQELRKRLAISE